MACKPRWWLAVASAAVLTATILAAAVRADVAPGDQITDQNMDQAKDLISPGLAWCIKHGWPITVGGTKRIDCDPKDPQIALEIMWNYNYQLLTTDDVDLRNFDADTGAIADHGPLTVERHFLLDHFRRLFWTGRLYVDPKPEKPNPSDYRAQQGLYQILEPFDLKGVGALGNRCVDSAKQDDSWLYLPSLQRVRRLSTAQRSDALFGQDIYDRSGELGIDLDQRLQLPEEGRGVERDRVRGRDGLRPGDRDGRHAARARDEGIAPEPALPRGAGPVLQPG